MLKLAPHIQQEVLAAEDLDQKVRAWTITGRGQPLMVRPWGPPDRRRGWMELGRDDSRGFAVFRLRPRRPDRLPP